MHHTKTAAERLALPLLLITAIIWGFAFAVQREISFHMGPFTFGTIRFFLGALSLLPLILRKPVTTTPHFSKKCFLHGGMAGMALFLAAAIQQVGIGMTTTGQAGFLSALYIVLVPLFGLFLGRKIGLNTYLSLGLSLPALYFLCMTQEGFHIHTGDAIVLSSVLFWTIQILLIDRYSKVHDPLSLCFAQFLICALFNLVCALLFET